MNGWFQCFLEHERRRIGFRHEHFEIPVLLGQDLITGSLRCLGRSEAHGADVEIVVEARAELLVQAEDCLARDPVDGIGTLTLR